MENVNDNLVQQAKHMKLFQLIIFITYVGYIVYRYGVLSSISESYYKVGGLFTIFCFSLGFPMFTYSKSFHPELATAGDYTFLFYLSMMLCFTGVAADFYRSNTIHFVGVAISVVSAFLGLGLQYGLWFPVVGCLVSVGVIALMRRNVVWWSEIACFIWIMIGLIII